MSTELPLISLHYWPAPLGGLDHLELFPEIDFEFIVLAEVYLTVVLLVLCQCLRNEKGRERVVWASIIGFVPLGFAFYLRSVARRRASEPRLGGVTK